MNLKKTIETTLLWIALIIFGIWTLFPFFMAVVTSLKKLADSYTLTFLPYLQFKPSFNAWTVIWGEEFQMLSKALINSIVVGSVSSLIVLILGCLRVTLFPVLYLKNGKTRILLPGYYLLE